jgi:hypothetical protein
LLGSTADAAAAAAAAAEAAPEGRCMLHVHIALLEVGSSLLGRSKIEGRMWHHYH